MIKANTTKVYALVNAELQSNLLEVLMKQPEFVNNKVYKGMIEVVLEDYEGFTTEFFIDEFFIDNEDEKEWTIVNWVLVIADHIMENNNLVAEYIQSKKIYVELINKIED